MPYTISIPTFPYPYPNSLILHFSLSYVKWKPITQPHPVFSKRYCCRSHCCINTRIAINFPHGKPRIKLKFIFHIQSIMDPPFILVLCPVTVRREPIQAKLSIASQRWVKTKDLSIDYLTILHKTVLFLSCHVFHTDWYWHQPSPFTLLAQYRVANKCIFKIYRVLVQAGNGKKSPVDGVLIQLIELKFGLICCLDTVDKNLLASVAQQVYKAGSK